MNTRKIKELDLKTLKNYNSYQETKNFSLKEHDIELFRLIEYLKTKNIYIHTETDVIGNIMNIKVFYAKKKYLKDTNLNTLESVLLMIFNELDLEKKYGV